MSQKHRNTIADQKSETKARAVGRPPAPRAVMLDAAERLFRDAAGASAESVSMDAIADAAGVGKGTLFRAFGDRDGLLEALAAARFASLRAAAEQGIGDFGGDPSPAQRATIFLDAVLTYKIDNLGLMRAREAAGAMNMGSERYRWSHGYLHHALADALPPTSAVDSSHLAHTLLAALQVNVIDALLAGGNTIDSIRRSQRELALVLTRLDPSSRS